MSLKELLKNRFGSINGSIDLRRIGGGSINEAYQITIGGQQFFCKVNSAYEFPQLFEKEKAGLELIKKQSVITVPEVVDCFETDQEQILILEWINEGERTEIFWRKFGEQLAAMHHIKGGYFGLDDNNYMGSVEQLNNPMTSWTLFFINMRLQPLVQKCNSHGLLSSIHLKQFEHLYKQLPALFQEEERPSLVHGDLWSGNFLCNDLSEPVLIDPAVYFGHRSADLAMTTLFGGFRSSFYEAYRYYYPLPSNYEDQWKICNLYPLLIHLLLFGKSYLSQIDGTLKRFS
jgi:protein-ribulosamine 3-kinase